MPGCTPEAAHTQKKCIKNCLHPETAVHQLFATFLRVHSYAYTLSGYGHEHTSLSFLGALNPQEKSLIESAWRNTSQLLLLKPSYTSGVQS